jgi:drug/metabolite transporter (DMT)-like permease
MRTLTSKQADLVMLVVAFIWGSGFVVTKNALDSLSAMQIMAYRFIAASIISAIFFRKQIKRINMDYIRSGSVMGLFLSLGFVFQTIGLQFTTAGNNAFLTSTAVVMVPFIYWLTVKRRPKLNNIAAAFMMMIGIFFLTVDFENFGDLNIGDMLTLIGAVFFALHIVSTGYFVEKRDPIALSTVMIFFSAIFFAIALAFDKNVKIVTLTSLWGALYLGLFSTFICFALQTTAQKFTSASHAAIILSLESVFGSILAVLLLKEGYNPIMVIGFIVIFFSVLMAEIGEKYFERWEANV